MNFVQSQWSDLVRLNVDNIPRFVCRCCCDVNNSAGDTTFDLFPKDAVCVSFAQFFVNYIPNNHNVITRSGFINRLFRL